MFEKRSPELEIMDDFSLQGKVLDQTLQELEIINTWLGGNDVTMGGLKKICSEIDLNKSGRSLSIADLGCGGGDILRLMAKWTRKKNIKVELTGIDANEYIINYARQNTIKFPEICYEEMNIFSEKFKKEKFDIINCTLFCHHFDNDSLLALLKQLKEQTRIAILINDLHRHWFAYHSIKWLTAFFSRSSMVKNDAKVSVLRAFKKKELEEIARAAGFSKISISWKWAFRFQMILYK